MKYFYNESNGITLLYPESWKDVLSILPLKMILRDFKWTWKDSLGSWISGLFRTSSYTVEIPVNKTNYPNESSC